MARAARRLREARRRHRRRRGARVLAELPLPVAGLLSDGPLAEVVEASRRRRRGGAASSAARRRAVPVARVPRALGDPGAEDHRPRARRRRRASSSCRCADDDAAPNAWVATMDDAGSEHARRLGPRRGGLVAAVGGGEPPDAASGSTSAARSSRPGSSTRTTTCTRPSRAHGLRRPTSSPGWRAVPGVGALDAEAEYAAARTGLAELALSGCTTVFDHHYVFPRGRAG